MHDSSLYMCAKSLTASSSKCHDVNVPDVFIFGLWLLMLLPWHGSSALLSAQVFASRTFLACRSSVSLYVAIPLAGHPPCRWPLTSPLDGGPPICRFDLVPLAFGYPLAVHIVRSEVNIISFSLWNFAFYFNFSLENIVDVLKLSIWVVQT
jgi:hypothetical protein